MTKEQRAARDRLIAYAQRPDVYYPPTPEECRSAYELIQAMESALRHIKTCSSAGSIVWDTAHSAISEGQHHE